MWLQFFAFQCLVDKYWGQSHTGVGWYLPKGRYCVSLGQNIRFEWGPLQMVHFSLRVVLVGHPIVFLFACLFACSVCFFLLTLGFLLFSSLLILIARLKSPNHTCCSRSIGGCSVLLVACTPFFTFLDFFGTCWVGLGWVWGYVLNQPSGKEISDN